MSTIHCSVTQGFDPAIPLAEDGDAMGLLREEHPQPAARRAGFALACLVPFAAYLLTASAYGYWYDAGEFVAASESLGIPHPPGQPLAALVGRLFAMLPLGSIAWRVALASAAMAALACGALYLAAEATLRAMGLYRAPLPQMLAVAAAWLVGGAQGFWFQAVRPEVYALQAALTFFMAERAIRLETRWPTHDLRPLTTLGLLAGLALANHHLLALFVFPAGIPLLARVQRAHGWRPLGKCALMATLGLLVYLYLPLRAAQSPLPNLGTPTTLSRFFWVVSAEAFQKNSGANVPQPVWERMADVGVQIGENVHVLVLLALGGLYAMLRTAGVWRVGMIWLLLIVVPTLGRAWLGFVRGNPDAAGYLMPVFGAVGVAAVAFLAELLLPYAVAPRGGRRTAAVAVAGLAAALGLVQMHHSRVDASLRDFHATDDFDTWLRRELPPRAVVLAHAPQTTFRFWGGRAVERLRPDVTFVPMPFISYPGMVASLVEREPELKGLLRGYHLHSQLRQPDLQSLAARRPLLLEMDVRVPPALYQTLAPAGLYYEVLADGATEGDAWVGAKAQRRMYDALYARLGPQRFEPATSSQLLWRHYTDALYYMGFGDRRSARWSIEHAKTLNPLAEPLGRMEAALDDETHTGPIDVLPFLRLTTR